MIVQCPTCILKYNNETVDRCRVCHPPKVRRSPSALKKIKERQKIKDISKQTFEILNEKQKFPQKQRFDYYAKGKRKF